MDSKYWIEIDIDPLHDWINEQLLIYSLTSAVLNYYNWNDSQVTGESKKTNSSPL